MRPAFRCGARRDRNGKKDLSQVRHGQFGLHYSHFIPVFMIVSIMIMLIIIYVYLCLRVAGGIRQAEEGGGGFLHQHLTIEHKYRIKNGRNTKF